MKVWWLVVINIKNGIISIAIGFLFASPLGANAQSGLMEVIKFIEGSIYEEAKVSCNNIFAKDGDRELNVPIGYVKIQGTSDSHYGLTFFCDPFEKCIDFKNDSGSRPVFFMGIRTRVQSKRIIAAISHLQKSCAGQPSLF